MTEVKQQSVQVEAILTGVSTKADGGLSVRFATNELSPEQKVEMMKRAGTFGWLCYKPNPFREDDLPQESAEDKNKTPSKRLRAALFVLWKQEGEQGDFEAYYRDRMEKLINHVKSKLD